MANLVIWNKFIHEQDDEVVKSIYPRGIHQCIKDFMELDEGLNISTATLAEDDHGLSDKFEYPMAPGLFPLNVDDNKIDLDRIRVKKPNLKKYIINLLKKHRETIATHEMDSGRIPNKRFEFTITFKDNVDTTPVACNEYPVHKNHKTEILRQLQELHKAVS